MNLKNVSSELFQQLIDLGEQLDKDHFTERLDLIMGASVGQHFRHIVEFYDCLKKGCESGKVSYDKRAHDKILEEEWDEMNAKLRELTGWVQGLEENSPLTLEAAYPLSNMGTCEIPSNLDRELVYNIEHAVHHMAIIKIAVMNRCPAVVLAPHFGVAQSTVVYRDSVS
ncbi:MAG: hypothetical protein MI784_15520 [Cytophagales bacterium]|nr:hypothetical protein [Cytophagales bacterium]